VPQLEDWQISPFYQPAREVGGDFYDFLVGELSSFTGEGWEQEDDITLLALRNSAASR
jgi:hypothetical protein